MAAQTDDYYFQQRKEVLAHIPATAKTVLDIGCGGGAFAGALKARQPVEIWGVEINEAVAGHARKNVDHLMVGDITKLVDRLPDAYFDCIVCNDVLEHLYDPYALLKELKKKLGRSGFLVCSLPNVRFIRILKNLIFKREWEYQTSGIMDFTHIRFFTKRSIENMFVRLGYRVCEIRGLNPRRASWGFSIVNFLLGGLLEDARFPQLLCKADVQEVPMRPDTKSGCVE